MNHADRLLGRQVVRGRWRIMLIKGARARFCGRLLPCSSN